MGQSRDRVQAFDLTSRNLDHLVAGKPFEAEGGCRTFPTRKNRFINTKLANERIIRLYLESREKYFT